MTCRGTHQGMPWAAHGFPWHTPRHAVAHTKACHGQPMACHGTHQGMPWHTPRHVMAVAHTKACHGSPWLAMPHTKACHGKPWHPMGLPWHTPRHALAPHGQAMAHTKAFFEEILGLWTRYFAHMLRKIIPSSLPSFTFFGKKKKKIIFLIGKIGKFIKNRKWVASGS
jgi:hypothetical protein